MRSIRSAAALAACFAVPAVTRAQVQPPHQPFAFTGPARTYTLNGCGSGRLSAAVGAPVVPVFCLQGIATVGTVDFGGGVARYQAVLDVTGTRLNGFDGRFYDIEYSGIGLLGTARRNDGTAIGTLDAVGLPPDPTGHSVNSYLFTYYNVGAAPSEFAPDGYALAPASLVELGYVPADAPVYDPQRYGQYLRFNLAVTETPEPAPLALTAVALGGIALIGAVARRRAA